MTHLARAYLYRSLVTLAIVSACPRNAGAGAIVDLRNGAPATLYGGRDPNYVNAGDLLGKAMRVADLDGDGLGDLICSPVHGDGPISDGRGEERFGGGQLYIFFGRSRESVDPLVDLTVGADITLYGAAPGDLLGFYLATGDVDRDDRDDIVFVSGDRLHVFFGAARSSFKPVYDLAIDAMSVVIQPPIGESRTSGEAFGNGLTIADLNGDGFEDIIGSDVFDRGPESNRVSAGAVHVILGRPRNEFPAVITVSPDDQVDGADVTIFGADRTDHAGFEVCSGDVDGDGVQDLLFSAVDGDGQDNRDIIGGEVYGFFGRSAWKRTYDIDTDEFDFALSGGRPTGFGYRLATGDLDGDGRSDIAVLSEIGLTDSSGLVRIVFGRPRHAWPLWSDIVHESDVAIAGFSYRNPPNNIFTIPTSLCCGDHDGDGFDDLALGAGLTDPPILPHETSRASAGSVYLYRGRPRGLWPVFMNQPHDDADLVVYGAAGSDEGTGVRSYDLLGFETEFGDMDGDGRDELLASAPFADGPEDFRGDCGEIYILFGPDTVVTTSTPPPADRRVQFKPNTPNPFNPITVLHFSVPPFTPTSLRIYDVRGGEVARLLDGDVPGCSECSFPWDAQGLPSGVYFARLTAEGQTATQKVILVR